MSFAIGDTSDRCCVAVCYKVPCPSDSQANDTNSCVAACPQGTGTAADTKKYIDCQQNCFNSHFLATGTAATETGYSGTTATTATGTWATATSTSGSKCMFQSPPQTCFILTPSIASSNDDNNDDASTTFGSASGTSTGVSKSTNAASNVKLGASSAGLFGLVVAAFAL